MRRALNVAVVSAMVLLGLTCLLVMFATAPTGGWIYVEEAGLLHKEHQSAELLPWQALVFAGFFLFAIVSAIANRKEVKGLFRELIGLSD